jgi:hypothetical protein
MMNVGLAFLIVVIILMIYIMINQTKEHIMVPGALNRYQIVATFDDDRAEFEKNEQKFYARYRT